TVRSRKSPSRSDLPIRPTSPAPSGARSAKAPAHGSARAAPDRIVTGATPSLGTKRPRNATRDNTAGNAAVTRAVAASRHAGRPDEVSPVGKNRDDSGGSPLDMSEPNRRTSSAACDMRFAARETAIFSQPEPALGALPGAGGAQHLARLMGRARALEIMLSAEDYDADLAERYGWINRALPAAALGHFVKSLGHRISAFPIAGQLAAKDRINAITLAPVEDFR